MRFYAWDAPAFWVPVQELIGLTAAEAEARAELLGYRFRDMTESLDHTDEMASDRVNVWCVSGVVTTALIY